KLGEVPGECGITVVRLEVVESGGEQPAAVHLVCDVAVGIPYQERVGVDRVEHPREVGDARGGDAEVGGDLSEGRARPDPELADLGVRVELVGIAACALAEVERALMPGGRRLH